MPPLALNWRIAVYLAAGFWLDDDNVAVVQGAPANSVETLSGTFRVAPCAALRAASTPVYSRTYGYWWRIAALK